MIRLSLLFTLLPAVLAAAPYDRPIPQAQSATAEVLFLAASVAMLAALVAVQALVRRR